MPEAERGLNRTVRDCPEFPVVARCSRPRRRAAGCHSIGNVALHIVVTSRRSLLRAGLTAAAVTAAAPLLPGAAVAAPGPAPARPPGDPFGLGVASGEPDATSVVLWTRLATDPLADDGLGGVGNRATDVEWEIADDERFTRVVRRGRVRTGPEAGHSVHVEVPGLRPGRDYHYRFRVGRTVSDAGRTRTAPPPASMTPVHMAFTSCSQFEHGWFTAYRRMAEERPDVLLHLGDYIYEYPAKDYVAPGGNVRDHASPETTTLAGYRQRLAQYHADADLQAAHAAAPWLVVFDDHEVENNWAGDVRELPIDPPGDFTARKAAAFRAYWENMPLRAAQRPRGAAMRLYRRVGYGGLVTFHMLDTRQYRGDQPCGDTFRSDCAERTDPARSLPGSAQEHWIADGFARSRARWDVLGQQVFFSQVDYTPGAGRGFNPDAWDGYPGSRDRVVDSWVAATQRGRARNLVVLTGDVHAHWGPTSSVASTTPPRRWSAPSWCPARSPRAVTARRSRTVPTPSSPRTRTSGSTTTAAATSAPGSPRTGWRPSSRWCRS
ncbi:secreted alkaline phosphatase [Pseudonocardia sp. Ae406_Ps2]|nr:secreted alkaline phosphatase [Pseudonocardia sp. Ae331_Ps2]OLM04701.1 secreted alkaline phosphatase [Pseudonocardia sp. Ae406_Ps2]OLM26268.1 secreted alkaline phosphatase [Pseudonocardia sp. Ae706_Ps2]